MASFKPKIAIERGKTLEMNSLELETHAEEDARIRVDRFEPDFQEAIDKILSSHDLARSQLKTATTDHLGKIQQKFDLALRVSSLNPDKQDVTRFVLNGMFENINETLVELGKISNQVMQQNLDVARQSISGLSKRIRSPFSEKAKSEIEPPIPSKSDFDAYSKLYLRMSVFILIFLTISAFSEDIMEGYRNISPNERFVQSILLMSYTFVLYYFKQFQ